MQYYLKEDRFISVGTINSKRHRVRFFNKKLTDFTFWPQIGAASKNDTNGVHINPDWDTAKATDDLQKWCASKYQPLDTNSNPIYVDKADEDIVTDEYGWAVNYQTIERFHNKAHLYFTRPLTTTNSPLNTQMDFKEGVSYIVHITWGLFDNLNDEAATLFGAKTVNTETGVVETEP